jgi:hypothetical protein
MTPEPFGAVGHREHPGERVSEAYEALSRIHIRFGLVL